MILVRCAITFSRALKLGKLELDEGLIGILGTLTIKA
jgi:hypothetical protein